MVDQPPVFIVLAPLFGALLCILLGMVNHRACLPVALVSLSASAVAAIATPRKATPQSTREVSPASRPRLTRRQPNQTASPASR